MLSQINGFRPQTKLKLLYRGSQHGWLIEDFHARCDNQGATLMLMRCKTGRVCGGYTAVSWLSPPFTGYYKYDPTAFLFSLDNRARFATKEPNQAVFHHKTCGPNFGNGSLKIAREPMNAENAGTCCTKNMINAYYVETDSEGDSILTGEGKLSYITFTCVEIEIFKVML